LGLAEKPSALGAPLKEPAIDRPRLPRRRDVGELVLFKKRRHPGPGEGGRSVGALRFGGPHRITRQGPGTAPAGFPDRLLQPRRAGVATSRLRQPVQTASTRAVGTKEKAHEPKSMGFRVFSSWRPVKPDRRASAPGA
jgi:hypothetical protein